MALKSGRVGIHPSQVDPITGMLLVNPSGASDLSDLGDVSISNPEAGQILEYNATSEKWENVYASISPVTPATLASLQDVRLTSISDDQILRYNSTSEKWENEDLPDQVNSDWNAASGVAQILNKPTIPSKTSDLQNDSGYITSTGYVWTSGVSALAGATTVTITDAAITTNSTIEVFASVQGLPDPALTISTGSCLLTFAALDQNTTFKLRISN